MPAITRAQLKQPLISEDNLKRVSDHVYVIEGFPNVAIVVGSRATLVVDTGLGERNGATVMHAAEQESFFKVRSLFISRPRITIPNTPRASRRSRRAQSSYEAACSRKK